MEFCEMLSFCKNFFNTKFFFKKLKFLNEITEVKTPAFSEDSYTKSRCSL